MGTLAVLSVFFPAPEEAGGLGEGATSPPPPENLSRMFVMV
jgi:hypothetical protein